jgi:glycosyltransferase involved in cell wall biosynthesis
VKILALTSSYPRFEGDTTAPFIESIVRHIAARGHQFDVVLPENREWARPPAEDSVRFHPFRYSPRRSWTPWGYSQSLEQGVTLRRSLYALAPIVALSARRKCTKLARHEQFDLLHAHWLVPNGVIAAGLSTKLELPLVISLHGSDVAVSERSRWMSSLVRRTFARASAVTAPSSDLLERAQRLGAKGTLEWIPYGADEDALRSDEEAAHRVRSRLVRSPDDVIVLGIGRLIGAKGFDVLIDAVAEARRETENVRLVFAGDGDLREPLTQRVRDVQLEESVTFAGTVLRDEIPAYLAAADIVAVPSVHHEGYVDGLPNVALEAMAAGKPIVATRVGGLPQVVHDGENGLLVEERDAAGLAQAIATLSRNPSLRERMGQSGRALIRSSLNWNTVAERFVSVYERAAGGSL